MNHEQVQRMKDDSSHKPLQMIPFKWLLTFHLFDRISDKTQPVREGSHGLSVVCVITARTTNQRPARSVELLHVSADKTFFLKSRVTSYRFVAFTWARAVLSQSRGSLWVDLGWFWHYDWSSVSLIQNMSGIFTLFISETSYSPTFSCQISHLPVYFAFIHEAPLQKVMKSLWWVKLAGKFIERAWMFK